jgi:hypothetical protein
MRVCGPTFRFDHRETVRRKPACREQCLPMAESPYRSVATTRSPQARARQEGFRTSRLEVDRIVGGMGSGSRVGIHLAPLAGRGHFTLTGFRFMEVVRIPAHLGSQCQESRATGDSVVNRDPVGAIHRGLAFSACYANKLREVVWRRATLCSQTVTLAPHVVLTSNS